MQKTQSIGGPILLLFFWFVNYFVVGFFPLIRMDIQFLLMARRAANLWQNFFQSLSICIFDLSSSIIFSANLYQSVYNAN
jgi:hypothetical protein